MSGAAVSAPFTPVDPERQRRAGAFARKGRSMADIDDTEKTGSAAALIPNEPDLEGLREAAAECTACPLYANATQTVFGEGPRRAAVMFVGEQPGDSEDLAGHPFVGPAGKMLDRSITEAGIDRRRAYVTNAVKHFKWVPRGARRIHSKPSSMEIAACFPWLEAEIAAVKPKIVVALGATAAQALFGKAFRVTRDRGRLVPSRWAPYALATVHPSALLRAPDEAARHREISRFIDDLKQVAQLLHSA
jgi:uracil-DNA glycosylase